MQTRHGSEVDGAEPDAGAVAPSMPPRPQPKQIQQPAQRQGPKIGRNDPCPCGSGQKFKKCHGAALEDGSEPDDASP
jgi:preprotein translocase subunit SecA